MWRCLLFQIHLYLLYPRKSHDIRPNLNKPINAASFISPPCQRKRNKWLKFGFSNMCDFILNKDLLMNMHYGHICHAQTVKPVAIYRLYARKNGAFFNTLFSKLKYHFRSNVYLCNVTYLSLSLFWATGLLHIVIYNLCEYKYILFWKACVAAIVFRIHYPYVIIRRSTVLFRYPLMPPTSELTKCHNRLLKLVSALMDGD